jgi:flagellar basal body-associated protein FliL
MALFATIISSVTPLDKKATWLYTGGIVVYRSAWNKMLKFFTNKTKISRLIYTALLSLFFALVGLLVIGTVYAIVRPSNTEALFKLGTDNTPASFVSVEPDIRIFSGLGRLRIPLEDSSILILSIAFPYHANDTAFTEELAAKIGDLRTIAATYFSSLPSEKTIQIDEEAAKTEVLRRFNTALRLGKIETVYFNDMMVIDSSG